MVDVSFGPPPVRYLAGEACHLAERLLLPAALVHGRRAGPNRHPVVVLPGLWSTDRSTALLRSGLVALGHDVRGWHLGRHRMWTGQSWAVLIDRLAAELANDDEPASLVGISAGGIVAREFARQRPDLVRQVITFGSPFRFRRGDTNRMSAITGRLRRDEPPSEFESLPREEVRPPLSVPVTAIYSRTDGLVDWRTCQEVPGRRRENIEVRGSHLGLASNAAVLIAVADRLACPPDRWRPFSPRLPVRALFPRVDRGLRPVRYPRPADAGRASAASP